MAEQQTHKPPVSTPPDGRNGADNHKYAEPKPEGQESGEDVKPGDKQNPIKKLVIGGIVAAILIVGLIWGLNFYHYSQTHAGTDDAQVAGNLVSISPIISGTLAQLTVDEGATVQKGQLIARLDDSGPRAALNQARAAYRAAQSQVPQAQISLRYQQQATDAAIRRAQAALASQNAKTSGAQQQVTLTRAQFSQQVAQSRSQVSQAQAQAAQAQAQADQFRAQVTSAQANVATYRQAIQTAQRAADAAGATVRSLQANAVKAEKDAVRYASLVQQEAVTPQQNDVAQAAALSAEDQVEAARQQAAQARSQVGQARDALAQAQAQLAAARKQAQAAQAQADAARQQIEVARAGLGLAQANAGQVGIQQSNVQGNVGQAGQAEADLQNALAGRTQINLRRSAVLTAQEQAQQAKAALANAQVTFNDTFIYAPSSGTVVRKAINVGAALSPGQSIVTMTQGDYVYVTANYKETQLRDVHSGQPAEVEVDTFPGRIFKGRVQSINEATGAATALLPPDNATGNFTKVVQRIPVRIELVPAGDREDKKYARANEIHALRQGMSVTATIDTSKH